MKPRVLFILKRHAYGKSFGLFNSCEFIVKALMRNGVEAKATEVTDNNDIDREVDQYQPTHVVIEALWVVPSKFGELLALHPGVKWIVRIHSNTPFLSGEGMAIEWIKGYAAIASLNVAANSEKLVDELDLAISVNASFLPNIYFPSIIDEPSGKPRPREDDLLNIGCFGAIRPLKNQLEQAVAAMIYANRNEFVLNFHVNTTRVEQNSDPIVKNLIALFQGTQHTLVSHGWLAHEDFVKLILQMDCGLQLSFSETFNLVGADFVFNSIPFVGSSELPWLSSNSIAQPTDWNDIADHIDEVLHSPRTARKNKQSLRKYSQQALTRWLEYLGA